MANNTVVNDVRLRMLLVSGRSVQVDASLGFRDSAPFEVEAVFHTLAGDITWTFARDLLAEGLHEQSGLGDISIWPDTTPDGAEVVYLSLISPSGHALLEADRGDIEGFVKRIYAAVPAGTEGDLLNIDFAIGMLLDEDEDDFLVDVIDREELEQSMRRHPSSSPKPDRFENVDFSLEFGRITRNLLDGETTDIDPDDDAPLAA